MKSAIITGITSSFGIGLAGLLSVKGVEVSGIVRPGSSRKDVISGMPGVRIVEMDLSDLGDRREGIIPEADCFFHLGWDKPSPDTKHNPGHSLNVDNTVKATRLAHELGCDTFIGIGSQAECGRVDRRIDENTPDAPEHEYGLAKVRAVEAGMKVCEDLGIRCIWPRLLSSYGPFDRPYTLIMSCIDACLDGRTMELTPCEQIWDYIYTDDVADALFRIAEKGRHGIRYPLGSGSERPLREYVEAVADAADADVQMLGIGLRPYPEGQPMYLGADISALTRDTGFRPATAFDEGIRRTVEWVIGKRRAGG